MVPELLPNMQLRRIAGRLQGPRMGRTSVAVAVGGLFTAHHLSVGRQCPQGTQLVGEFHPYAAPTGFWESAVLTQGGFLSFSAGN